MSVSFSQMAICFICITTLIFIFPEMQKYECRPITFYARIMFLKNTVQIKGIHIEYEIPIWSIVFAGVRVLTISSVCSYTTSRHVDLWSICVLYILTYLLTYLLTAWCRVLLEQLTGLQLVKKFPAFHRTRRFIIALTSVCHLSLSWASPI